MTRTRGPLRSVLTALLATSLMAGCVDEDPIAESSLEARGGGRDDAPAAGGVSCTTEMPTPAARGALVIDGEPSRATTARVEATNTDVLPRLIGARIRTQSGGVWKTSDFPPAMAQPGETISHTFDLRALGIEPATATLPSRLSASLTVLDENGRFLERVGAGDAQVGPSVVTALDSMLRGTGVRARSLTSTGIKGLTATVVGLDEGDTGLFPDQIDDPFGPNIPPNYSNAVPDENGLFHHDFCLSWPMDLVDAGFGEDYGADAEGSWRARGGKLKITSHGQTLFDTYLDVSGCTGTISTPYHSDFLFIGYSMASLGGNTVIAKDEDGNAHAWVRQVANVGGTGTKYYDLPQGSLTNLVAVPVFTIGRFGGVSGETFTVNSACYTEGDSCCNCAAGDEIWISDIDRKFLIAHEMGHRILALRTGGYNNDCDLNVSNVHPCYSSSGHAIDSLEFASCAAMEGWAHFVAVRTFNDHLTTDATFQYWRNTGLTVDVEQGPDGGVDTYYEALCGGTNNNAAGRGIELDWLRAWWDYHTDAGTAPSTSQMMDEIAEKSTWINTNTYQFITDGIESFSGDDQRDRWTSIATSNGIDH